MKRILLLISLIISTLASYSASDGVYIDYCEGTLATSTSGTYTGIPNAGTYECAIRIPAEKLAAYVGNELTKVSVGIPSVSSVTLPTEKITVWVRHSKDGENLASAEVKASKGWKQIALTSAYSITGEEAELWVGYTWTQTTKLNILSFAGPTDANGCWVKRGANWQDYSNQNKGSLAIRAYVEGAVPQRDLAVQNLTLGQKIYEIGDEIIVRGEVKNKAIVTAEKPVLKYALNGEILGEMPYTGSLKQDEKAEFKLVVPTDGVTEEGTYVVTVEAVWNDSLPDDFPSDNVASIDVELAKEVFVRKMVVEEGTGTWCGNCPRGIVAMEEMNERYPDTFIGIAIHHGDDYATAYPAIINQLSGYPQCMINREGLNSVSTDAWLGYYREMPSAADAKVKVSGWSANGKKVNATAEITFGVTADNCDYRVIFVLLEDGVGAMQTNYYANNAGGKMGGFESMSNPCYVELMDVARGVYPDSYGLQGKLPTSVKRMDTAKYEYAFTLPTVEDKTNLSLVALLIDGATGQIVNGDKTDYIPGVTQELPEGIETVRVTTSTAQSYWVTPMVKIENGKKMLIK